MKNRNLDGVYFRVNRGGEWQPICFSDLTPEERDEVLKGRPAEWLKNLCCILADTIKNIGEVFDLEGK